MAVENGEWIMRGMDWNDPYRIRSRQELIHWSNEVGFLPFFKMRLPDFPPRSTPPTAIGGTATRSRAPGSAAAHLSQRSGDLWQVFQAVLGWNR
jgi:hypothetical protein